MKVLVTGASGFIGRHLSPALLNAGHEVRAAGRSRVEMPGIFCVRAPELGPDADWSAALDGVEAVVHLAGRAQVDARGGAEVEGECRKVNELGTRALAVQAARSGVKHFVFMSSLHAVAASSDQVVSGEAPARPVSAYGRSKLDAEKALREELQSSDCEWTILRPPLVYGPGNFGNFGLLLKLVKAGIPLPLASVRNRRSFIYVENLVDVVKSCLGNPKAFGKTFLPSDGVDVSTPELIRKIAEANQSFQFSGFSGSVGEAKVSISASASRHSTRLFPFPEGLLKVMGRLPGMGALGKLTSSLYTDSEPLRRELGWTPPFKMEEGLRRALVDCAVGGIRNKRKQVDGLKCSKRK
jgi:nucleoside-diphosphate-sugar epimerase